MSLGARITKLRLGKRQSLQEVADAAARTSQPDAGQELLHAARAGDRTALQRLCSGCLPALRACARRLLPRTQEPGTKQTTTKEEA